MMDITIDRKIGDKGPWAEGIERANQILELIGANSTAHPTVKWDLDRDEDGEPVLVLILDDPLGSVEKRFPPDELEDSEKLWRSLRRLWTKLLQVQGDQMLRNLLST